MGALVSSGRSRLGWVGRGLRPDRAVRDRKILGVPARCGEGSAGVSGLRGICPGPPVRLRSHSTGPTPLLALTGPSGNGVRWV